MASSPDGISTDPAEQASVSELEALNLLRNILLEPEQSQLEQLQNRLDDPTLQAKDVSRVLPDAILLRSKQDKQLAKSLSPIIEDGFMHSIEKSPQRIADAISPIMGPAISGAIRSALHGMVQSLNQTLEHSVSWKGLQWRIESFRTGKPFAEIVLLHTLRFRVEQVFLIHRETGLLLQHVAAEIVAIQDEEVVSGMLTAIQDFVRDSFGGGQSDSLESLRVGELTVWIEQGSRAILAGVVRGNPPLELREVFQQVLATVQVEFSDAFETFSGNQSLFEMTRPRLEDCLQAQFEGRSSKPSPFLWVMLILLCGGFVAWGVLAYIDQQRWQAFFQKAENEPGIIVTRIDKNNGTLVVNGLRDPLSVEPSVLAEQAGLDIGSIQFQLEPYFAMSPQFQEMRVRSRLQPPDSVNIRVQNTHLVVTGQASHQWISRLEGIQHSIPGLMTVDTEHLTDTDMTQLETLRKDLERHHFFFARGSTRLTEAGRGEAVTMANKIQELDNLAERLGQRIRVEIRGQSSQEGSQLRNKQLRIARANAVKKALPLKGLTNTSIDPVELRSDTIEKVSADPAFSRQVSLRVFLENMTGVGRGIRE